MRAWSGTGRDHVVVAGAGSCMGTAPPHAVIPIHDHDSDASFIRTPRHHPFMKNVILRDKTLSDMERDLDLMSMKIMMMSIKTISKLNKTFQTNTRIGFGKKDDVNMLLDDLIRDSKERNDVIVSCGTTNAPLTKSDVPLFQSRMNRGDFVECIARDSNDNDLMKSFHAKCAVKGDECFIGVIEVPAINESFSNFSLIPEFTIISH